MIQEDQNQLCSNTSSGGDGGATNGHGGDGGADRGYITRSSSKKLKQKKVPQRGLGVAQLEKIRMEEQQKKDGNNFSSSSTISSTNNNNNNNSSSLPNYPTTTTNNNNTNHKSSKSIVPYSPPSSPPPPPPPMPINLYPSNPIFRTHSLAKTENFSLSSIPFLNGSNGDGFQVGWPSIPVHGNVSLPKFWNPNPHEISPDHKGENSIFSPNLSFPYETCNIAPFSDVVPRSNAQPHQPSSCTNSLVNVSSINLSSSSVLSFPMEPPSNQNILSNYSSFSPNEDKMMVGMKRSYHLPTIPTFGGKFSPVTPHPLNRSDESTLGGIGGTTYNLDSTIPMFNRDIPSCPSAMREPTNSSKKNNRTENGNSNNGEFLSLAPPTLTSSFPNSRFKQIHKFETLPYQVSSTSIEDPIIESRHGGSSQHQNLFSLFPSTMLQATTSVSPPTNYNSCNGEIGENVDLNLKL